MTAAEELAACLALGRSRALCDQLIAAQSVGGVYCDGTIVIDESGHRCIPRAVVDRVSDARKSSPLPIEDKPGVSPWLVGGVIAAALVVVVWAVRS